MPGFFAKHPLPPAASFLGWTLLEEDEQSGCLTVAFHPTAAMLNFRGTVQGGFVAAMLDDVMGPALVSVTDGADVAATIDMNVTFVKPVFPGRVIGKGRVISRGRSIAYLEAELFDESGALLARATSSARILPGPTRTGGEMAPTAR